MIRKISFLTVIFYCFVSINLFANNSFSLTNKTLLYDQDPFFEDKKELRKQDFIQMINLMEKSYNMGDLSKAYLLGIALKDDQKLQDGVLKANKKRAIEWFKRALNDGYGISAIQLVNLVYIPNRDYYGALDIIEEGMNKQFVDNNARIVLAVAYGGLVLDYMPDSKKYVRKAIDFIVPVVNKNAISTLDYIFANLLNLDNQFKLANKFLNSACNNPKVPPEIWNICIRGKNIVMKDSNNQLVKKDKETNCPVNVMMPGLSND